MKTYDVVVEEIHIWRYRIEAEHELAAFDEAADRSLREPRHEMYTGTDINEVKEEGDVPRQ